MRLYVNNLEPDLQVTLCDDEVLDLTNPFIGVQLLGYKDFFYDELLWTRDIPDTDRSLVEGCTVLDMAWQGGETADRPWWTYHRMAIKALFTLPPGNEPQEIRMLRTVKVRV